MTTMRGLVLVSGRHGLDVADCPPRMKCAKIMAAKMWRQNGGKDRRQNGGGKRIGAG
jgi:hypothetical protein